MNKHKNRIFLFPSPSFDEACLEKSRKAQDDIGWKNSLLTGIQKILPFRVRVKGFSASNSLSYIKNIQ